MNRHADSDETGIIGVPRTHGDEPMDECEDKGYNDVFPVPTGMNLNFQTTVATPACVPRTHGDEPRLII